MPELTPAQIGRLARKLSFRSADNLDWLVTGVAEDTTLAVHFGDAHDDVARMLRRLGLIERNPNYLVARRDWDRREWLATDLGREVLAILKADILRFYPSGNIVSRGEYGKPADCFTISIREGREPTEAELDAYFGALYAEAGIAGEE